MRARFFLAVAVLCLAASASSAGAAALDRLTAGEPVADAKRAFAAGDARFIVLPLCQKGPGEILPGWPIEVTTQHIRAIEAGKRPLNCEDLATDDNFDRAVAYVERYNRALRELIPGTRP